MLRGMAESTPPPPNFTLLLSLWANEGVHWRVRLIGPDAQVHEFDSPFELARFLAQTPRPLRDDRPGGLR